MREVFKAFKNSGAHGEPADARGKDRRIPAAAVALCLLPVIAAICLLVGTAAACGTGCGTGCGGDDADAHPAVVSDATVSAKLPDGLEYRPTYSFGSAAASPAYSITGYTGSETKLIIPAAIDGVPVVRIDEGAFSGCEALTSVILPAGVTVIDDGAFTGCTSLTDISVSGANTVYSSVDGLLCSRDGSGLIYCPGGRSGELALPDGVINISSRAFTDCTSLTGISVSEKNTVYSSRDGILCSRDGTVLFLCPRGRSGMVVIPDGAESIVDDTFEGCAALTGVTLPDSLTDIADGAFTGCTSLAEISVSGANPRYSSRDGVLFSKDGSVLLFCPSGRSGDVIIPDGVTCIGEMAFRGCKALTGVTIPDSVTSIGEMAFRDCTSLTGVTIPDSVTTIDYSVFKGCSSLTDIAVGDANTAYSSAGGILYNKDRTVLVCCPGGKSGSVTVPAGVTTIGEDAFDRCAALTGIALPDSVTDFGQSAFPEGCPALTDISVSEANPCFSSSDGILYNKDKTALVCCPCGKSGEVVIPAGVTGIGNYAFDGCAALTGVTLPDGVTSIGRGAFGDCAALTGVNIPAGVTDIGDYAFFGCVSLTGVSLPGSVTGIGCAAFRDCASLTDITIPDGVTEISDYAFCGCTSLTGIVIPAGVKTIGGRAFEDCTALTSVTIPDGVTSIGDYAFYGCEALTGVTIPESVTSIGESAFKYCPATVRAPHDAKYYGCEPAGGVTWVVG